MTLSHYENQFGKFEAMLYVDEDGTVPYAIWSEEYVNIIIGKDDALGIGILSVSRNPSNMSFG